MPTQPQELLARLNDSRSVAHAVASTVAAGGLALVDPRDLAPRSLWAFRAANAGFAGWMTWAVMSTEVTDQSRRARAGATAGAVGLTIASSRWSEGFDARVHDRLVRWGIKRPRVVLALLSTSVGMASWWRARQPDEEPGGGLKDAGDAQG